MINYNVTGSDRKRLVGTISRETGVKAIYKGVPTMAYDIGTFTVDRNGTLTWTEGTEPAIIRKVVSALEAEDFKAEEPVVIPDEPADEEEYETEPYTGEELTSEEMKGNGLTISLPLDGFSPEKLELLQKLVDSKASLIRKAVDADSLTIRITGDKVEFPWWDSLPTPEETQAYMAFVSALCARAKEAKRVNATDHAVESEKFAFRVFLLSLGFTGPEHKTIRNTLLKPLSGSAAFPTQAAAEEFAAKQKAKRAEAKAEMADGSEEGIGAEG